MQRRLRPALGCLVRIEAGGALADAELGTAIDAAYAQIEAVEQALSFHRLDSELHVLHREAVGREHRVGTHLWNVLAACAEFWRLSAGVFDPGVAAALVRENLLPRPDGLTAPDPDADFSAVELLSGRRVRFARALWLDFGGIAKGYAVDQALAVLRAAGVRNACVNAGGDLACFGDERQIALRDPQAPGAIAHTIRIRDAACATSGDYFRPAALRTRGGRRSQRQRGSLSVIAADCMHADALTKIAWAAADNTAALLAHYGARCIDLPAHAAGPADRGQRLRMEPREAAAYDARP